MVGYNEQFFRENMKRRREAQGLSQTDIAKRMKTIGFPFHQQTIQRIETGDRPIRLDEAFAIAELLESSVDSMCRSISPGLGDVVAAVDRLQRKTQVVSGDLAGTFSDWLDAFFELAVAFDELRATAGGVATPYVRTSAAWVVKGLWAADAFDELQRFLNGLVDGVDDWHDTGLSADLAGLSWIADEGADLWSSLPEAENPIFLADGPPAELLRRLEGEFAHQVKELRDSGKPEPAGGDIGPTVGHVDLSGRDDRGEHQTEA